MTMISIVEEQKDARGLTTYTRYSDGYEQYFWYDDLGYPTSGMDSDGDGYFCKVDVDGELTTYTDFEELEIPEEI